MNKEYLKISFIDFLVIIIIIVLLSMILSMNVLGDLKDNCFMNLKHDLNIILEHLNANLSDDPNLLYGKKIEFVNLLKNNTFIELVKKGKVINEEGIVSISSFNELNNSVILDLSPFLINLPIKNQDGFYIGVSNDDKSSFDIFYINNEDNEVIFNKVSFNNYLKIMKKNT